MPDGGWPLDLLSGAERIESRRGPPGFAGLSSRNSFVHLPGRCIVVCSIVTTTKLFHRRIESGFGGSGSVAHAR